MAGKEDIDKIYKENFGVNFSKMTPEQMRIADSIVSAASSPDTVMGPNGAAIYNPKRAAFDAYKQESEQAGRPLSKKLTQQLGVYANWRAGIVPSAGEGAISDYTKAQAAKAGVPLNKLKEIETERKAEWTKSALNRFAHLAPPDKVMEMPAEDISVEVPKDSNGKELVNPLQQATPPPAQAMQAAGGNEGALGTFPAAAPNPIQNQIPPDAGMPADQPPPTGVTGPSQALPEMQQRPGVRQ